MSQVARQPSVAESRPTPVKLTMEFQAGGSQVSLLSRLKSSTSRDAAARIHSIARLEAARLQDNYV